MLTMVNPINLEVTVKRWRSRWVSLTNVGCAGMLRFALVYFIISSPFWIYPRPFSKKCLRKNINGVLYVHYLLMLISFQVHGHMAEKYLVIDVPIGSDATYTDVHRMCVYHKDKCEKALSAVTEVYCLEEGIYDTQPASKVLLVPKTGIAHICKMWNTRTLVSQSLSILRFSSFSSFRKVATSN